MSIFNQSRHGLTAVATPQADLDCSFAALLFLPSAFFGGGLARLYVPCKGGNDEVGGHGWRIGTRTALSPPLQKPQRWASDRPMRTLNARSLHSTDHRLAMICFGRDDRVGES